MNRTLRRPMFRIGGVAEGITSGLQPRQGFAFAGTANQHMLAPDMYGGIFDKETLQILQEQYSNGPNSERLQKEFPTFGDYLRTMAETIGTAVSGQKRTDMGISQTEDQVNKYNKVIGEVNKATGLSTPKYTLDYDQFEGPPPGHPEYNVTADFHPGGIPSFDTVDTSVDNTGETATTDNTKTTTPKRRGSDLLGGIDPDFLVGFGLDLLTRPKSGNIFQQAAASAKIPFEKWRAEKTAQEDRDWRREWEQEGRDIDAERFAEEMALKTKQFDENVRQFGIEQATELAVAELESRGGGKGWLKQWEFDQIPILNKTISKLTKKQETGTITADEELDLQNAIDQKSGIVDLDEVTKAFLNTKRGGYLVEDEMDKLILEDNKLPKEDRKYKGKRDPQLAVDAIDNVKKRLGMAKGGRVGYQMGGATIPSAMPAAMTMNQGAEQVPEELQNIDYNTLRARLPASITDDIVRLIASSAEAMEDFATIQTQQDINNFNQKYGVELVLPAEA